MVKLMFFLYRKPGLSRDECIAKWTGEQHLGLLEPMRPLGFRKYIQNRVASTEPDGCPDGIGELWFESSEAMQRLLESPEWGAAYEDAERFADLTKSHGLVVAEDPVFG